MTPYLALLLFLVLALAGALWWRRRRAKRRHREPSLSPQERALSSALQSTLDTLSVPLRVFAKVKIADVLAPGRGRHRDHWLAEFAQLREKTFDFVLCEAHSLKIRAAIEIEKPGRKAQQHDLVVQEACKQLPLPLLRFPSQRHYPLESVREPLMAALPELMKPAPSDAPQVPPQETEAPLPDESQPVSPAATPTPLSAQPDVEAAQTPEATIEHLSTEEFAERIALHPRALLALLARLGYLEWDDDGQLQLTEKGRVKGAVQWQDEADKRQFQWAVRDRGLRHATAAE
ncbi:DUF2726 domain-containing protein [Ferrimonas balearica]|uniref:DUF2726 domain-containing protein n=1 Tax=Ferrimonas balearica TaxID=44012 RepID=UPI001C99E1B0|nr:DUF2726 domain-containing protein [Ferrimonas balearica]MBY5992869.1 DUF2726 domain-containing protein [Ferrimonas balearica]